ncbi:AbiH family protein [Paenibacillus sp. FSL M7-0896]|uniref:AbiH family protein n=1 Tax=Paenibacillus sp. FSL M7-0896 TaxID=2921610 RepID=UPI0030DBD8AD
MVVLTITRNGGLSCPFFWEINTLTMYITFNYTAVLETVYKVSNHKIIHIHGSLRQHDDEPVLGHGNKMRINDIQEKREEAERVFDEKGISICRVVEQYYNQTFKDINLYMYKLRRLMEKEIDEIIILGHSLAGVDIPYFQSIDTLTKGNAKWKVYYFNKYELQPMLERLVSCEIDSERIEMIHAPEFYNK